MPEDVKDDDRSVREQVGQLRHMFRFAQPYKWRLGIGTVAVLVSSALGLVFPALMGLLVDAAVDGVDAGDTSQLNRFAVLLLVVFAIQGVFNYIRTFNLAVVGEGVVADLRRALFDRIIRLPVPFFDEQRTGDITSRLTSDAVVVQGAVSDSLSSALSQTITLIGGVVLLVLISPLLSLSVLTFVPLIILGGAIYGRVIRKISTSYHDQLAVANAVAEESISAVRVVKWFSAEDRLAADYDHEVTESYRIAYRRARLQALFGPLITFVAFSTLAVVIWLGGRLVSSGDLSAGQLVTFLLYTLTVAGAIGSFTSLYGQIQTALGASQRIFQLLGMAPEVGKIDSDIDVPEPLGSLSFSGVDFSYASRDTQVLTDVDIEVAPGEVIALVGPSGAGKSTIVQLIPRFYDVDRGSIEIDGLDVRDYPTAELRRRMAAVPQEVQMFSGTITENLRIARPDASEDDLVDASIAANAHQFISEFPDGYESLVGERGVKLSGGQRQRIAIARALLADPRILILDEATSSLDAESEGLVQEALKRLMKGRTTIVIAHRLSTVIDADRLLVVAAGRVVEQGTHGDLIEREGLYAKLYAKQLTV